MDREARILSLEKAVRAIATNLLFRLAPQARRIHREDFIQAAWMGAIQAVDHYDPSKASLATYANWKIMSAVLDYMRASDYLDRGTRRRGKQGEALPVMVRMRGELGGESFEYEIGDASATEAHLRAEARIGVKWLLSSSPLEPLKHQVLVDCHLREIPMNVVAKQLGVCDSRVSQICKEALQALSVST